jgi:endonuclease/exonuclease/phosphatase family metal-dependent hydrolase
LSASSDIAKSLRVMTLNAHQGLRASARREALIRLRDGLREADADLVFLQEIGVASGSGAAMTQYEVLADSVWSEHAYGRNAVAAGGHHGNALLSKFPVLDWRNVDATVGRKEPRGFLHCSVGVPSGASALHAICVHIVIAESHRRHHVAHLVDHVVY